MSKLFQGAAHCLPAGPSAVVPPPAAWQTHPAQDAGPAATPAGGRPLLSQHVAEAGRPAAGSPPRLQGTWTFLRDSPVAPPRRSRARKESEAGEQKKDAGAGPGHSVAPQRPQGWAVHLEKVGAASPLWPGRELVQPTPPCAGPAQPRAVLLEQGPPRSCPTPLCCCVNYHLLLPMDSRMQRRTPASPSPSSASSGSCAWSSC